MLSCEQVFINICNTLITFWFSFITIESENTSGVVQPNVMIPPEKLTYFKHMSGGSTNAVNNVNYNQYSFFAILFWLRLTLKKWSWWRFTSNDFNQGLQCSSTISVLVIPQAILFRKADKAGIGNLSQGILLTWPNI